MTNHADMTNQLPENYRSLQIAISGGPITNAMVRTKTVEWFRFCDYLRVPKTGQKDGSYFLRGVCDGERCNNNMNGASLAIVDADKRIDPGTGEILAVEQRTATSKISGGRRIEYTARPVTLEVPWYRSTDPVATSQKHSSGACVSRAA